MEVSKRMTSAELAKCVEYMTGDYPFDLHESFQKVCDSHAELERENERLVENLLLTFSDVCKERKEEISDLTAQLAAITAATKEKPEPSEFFGPDTTN